MKLSSCPSLRVVPKLREAAESVLRDGETRTSLIETSVRDTIQRGRVQEEFITRGLRSREDAQRTGVYPPLSPCMRNCSGAWTHGGSRSLG